MSGPVIKISVIGAYWPAGSWCIVG